MEPGGSPNDPYVICPLCKRPTWVETAKLPEHLKDKHGVDEAVKAKTSAFLADLFE